MFRGSAERAEERARREEEQARTRAAEAERREREAFLASPVGRATEAWEAGDTFFEIQLEVGDHRGEAGFGATQGEHRTASSGRVLGEIEGVGWVLEHVGYTYMMTGQTSSERMFASGEATAISGKTLGIYLFRNPTVARPGPAPAD